jgi:2Fe-2S iron-sulfur cluster binding domain
MLDQLRVTVNGSQVLVPTGATVAVAMAIAGQPCRTSVIGEPRTVLKLPDSVRVRDGSKHG